MAFVPSGAERGWTGGKFPGDYTGLSATPARVADARCVSSKPPNASATFHQTLYAATLRPW